MRIVYLHQYFKKPDMAGGTRSYEMSRRLAAAGHEVHMITSRPSATPRGWQEETVAGVTVHWYPIAYDNSMGFVRRTWAFLAFAVAATRRVMRVKADVVFATSTPLTIAIPAVAGKWRSQAPMVFEVRDLWPEMPIAVGALQNRGLRLLARLLEKWAYRSSQEVVALSPGMADGVAAAGVSRERIHVIPNSCDLELFQVSQALGEEFRRQRPWLGSRPLVVYAGTFGRVNGVEYLVRLAAETLARDGEVRFLAVGAGAEYQRVHDAARKAGVLDVNFFLESALPKSEMPAVLNAATVCTSLFLPIPEMEANSANKFFDGLAAGKPVAINYGGWQADLIHNEKMGLVLHPLDEASAATELLDFLSDPVRVSVAGTNATRVAVERFDRNLLSAQLRDVLESACR
jgi:glycosyltransferase involved in cell wall biosynthesis